MSRSRKKNPGGGFSCAPSDKPGKVRDNRRYRHYMNQKVHEGEEEIEHPYHKIQRYTWPKDGKQYWPEGIVDRDWMGK